jgi:hypothetical protein
LRPAAREIRPILDGLIPTAFAVDARDQHIASDGVSLAVFVNAESFTSSRGGRTPYSRVRGTPL